MRTSKRQIFSFDISLFLIMTLLITLSIIALYSVGYNKSIYSSLYLKQFLWFALGLIIMLFIFAVNMNKINSLSTIFYVSILILLVLTLIFGKTVRGTKGWIVLGSVNFQFSELAKIITILSLAKYLEYHFNELNQIRKLLLPFGIGLFPVFFILLQPDLGTTLAFFPIIIVMLYLSGANTKNIVYLLIIGIISILLPLLLSYYEFKGILENKIWIKTLLSSSFLIYIITILFLLWIILKIINKFYPEYVILNRISTLIIIVVIILIFSFVLLHSLKPYQKRRLLVFLDPAIDPYGTGYNIVQSKITIGSGRFLGKGFLQGSQTQLGFLPEQNTDFVITVIGEEFGWVGMTILLLLYFLFILQGFSITYTAKDVYSSLVAGGITTMFAFGIFINIGVTIGIMPVTGVPAPFLSYGGSSLISSMIATALLINIKSQRFL